MSDMDSAPMPAALADSGTVSQTAQPAVAPSRGRFRITLVLLVAVAVAAIAIAIAVASNGNTHSGVKATGWSSWVPSSNGTAGINQIAAHVGPHYRTNASTELDEVTQLSVTSTSSTGTTTGKGPSVAVDATSSSSSSSAGELELLGGNTVAYDVCGLGTAGDCSLGGTPSAARLLLLRREALELALYTFQYISGTDNVLVVLPPGRTKTNASGSKTKAVTVSVLFVKKELQQFLNHPLTHTLGAKTPSVSELTGWIKTEEAAKVNAITESGLFSAQIESEQEGGRLLVLDQLSS
jgi:hypothetical protein